MPRHLQTARSISEAMPQARGPDQPKVLSGPGRRTPGELMAGLWVALLVLIVWAIARAFPTSDRQRGGDAPRQESSEEILDRRYAAGELDTDTYQSMRATLNAARSARE